LLPQPAAAPARSPSAPQHAAPAKVPDPVVEPAPSDLFGPSETIAIPDFGGMGVGRALETARVLHLPVEIAGSGRVVAQDPPAGPVAGASRLVLRFSDETRASP
jgi:hypothetical protein